jgi:hypothetical protein
MSLKTAVEKLGGAPQTAAFLKVTHQAVYGWLARGWAPGERAVQLEKKTGVPRAMMINPKLRKLLAA